MATTAWAELLKEILVEVPGVSDPLAEQQVRNAAIDFCARAWVWIVDQETIPVEAGINDYEWDLPAKTELARVLVAWLGKKPLLPKTRGELSAMYGDFMQIEGRPQWYVQDASRTLLLVPRPSASETDGITAKLAVKPTRAAEGIDSAVFERHYDKLALGAKARLMAMANKPWSNPQFAVLMQERFDLAIAEAKLEVLRSFSGARLRVPTQFF